MTFIYEKVIDVKITKKRLRSAPSRAERSLILRGCNIEIPDNVTLGHYAGFRSARGCKYIRRLNSYDLNFGIFVVFHFFPPFMPLLPKLCKPPRTCSSYKASQQEI